MLRDLNGNADYPNSAAPSGAAGPTAPTIQQLSTADLKLISSYIANRRAGPVTREAIAKRFPHIDVATIQNALNDAQASGQLVALNFIDSITRCQGKLDRLHGLPENLFDAEANERRASQIKSLETQLSHLQNQMGQLRRRQSSPNRPLTLIEHIASSGGIRVPSRSKARKKLRHDNPNQMSLFGGFSVPDERTARDCEANDLLSVIDGGPVLISMFGPLAYPNCRLSFGQAAEAALEAGFYAADQYGNGVDNTAFTDLLRQDYNAWLARDWDSRVFSQRDASTAAEFLESLSYRQSTEEGIDRYGYPVAGEDCPHWKRHIRQQYHEIDQKGIGRAHLNYAAHKVGIDMSDAERMTTRELVSEIRYGLDMMDEDRSVRTMTTFWVTESAFPSKARKYERLLAAAEASKAQIAQAEAEALKNIPFDSDDTPKRVRSRSRRSTATFDDCPF